MKINLHGLVLLFASFSFLQDFESVRFMGLGANYSTISDGCFTSKTNPASLYEEDGLKVGLFKVNFGLANNLLNLNTINDLNGSHLDDPNATKYFPKSYITDIIQNNGFLISGFAKFPLPFSTISYKNFSFSNETKIFGNVQIPEIFLNTILKGNNIGERLSINMDSEVVLVNETSFSRSFDFNDFRIGIGGKYLLGLFYAGIDEIEDSYFLTDSTKFNAQGSYLIKQGIGGDGIAFDLGLLTSNTKNGWKFGFSFNNLFGIIKWKNDHFIREAIDPILKNNLEENYLRQGEYYYINFLLDSLNAISLTESNYSDLVNQDMFKVIIVEDTTGLNISPSDLIIISNDEFLIESASINELNNNIQSTFSTIYPKYFHMGFSKRTTDDIHFHFDLSSGFSKSIGGYDNWLIAFGTEFLRFKHIPLRMGMTIGGNRRLSFSFGGGGALGPFSLDIGVILNNSLNVNKFKGFSYGLSISYSS